MKLKYGKAAECAVRIYDDLRFNINLKHPLINWVLNFHKPLPDQKRGQCKQRHLGYLGGNAICFSIGWCMVSDERCKWCILCVLITMRRRISDHEWSSVMGHVETDRMAMTRMMNHGLMGWNQVKCSKAWDLFCASSHGVSFYQMGIPTVLHSMISHAVQWSHSTEANQRLCFANCENCVVNFINASSREVRTGIVK